MTYNLICHVLVPYLMENRSCNEIQGEFNPPVNNEASAPGAA